MLNQTLCSGYGSFGASLRYQGLLWFPGFDIGGRGVELGNGRP